MFPDLLSGNQKKWIGAAALVASFTGIGWQFSWFKGSSAVANTDLLTYQVKPRDLPISIIERGNLESQTNVQVFCEVDDYRSDGINGTPIVWIIPNGSSVSKGDLICELDSTAIQTELDEQTLDTEEARSLHFQAQANLENQEIQNKTEEDKAELDIELARLELEMFEDKTKGSHKLALEAIQREIDDLKNEILAAEMNLKLRRNEKVGMESLFKLGYAGKSELDRSVLGYLQAEGDYAAQLNKLQTRMASLEKLDYFDRKMQKLELDGKLKTAIQNQKQTLVTNKARMSQMEGILTSRTEQLKKEEERLERYKRQLSYCKIYAPQDGMIAYATSSSYRDEEIGEGIPVRPRQHILSIPNLRQMQVETDIHESALDRVQQGLRVAITVDAFPDRTYTGSVKSVAVLPERNYYSDTKTYKTVVTIDEEVYQIKPGMTAVCEIKVDHLPQVNAVPIQAVVQRSGDNWLYVKDGSQVERRKVDVGASNDQYVVITDGVDIGDLVVLNPGAVHDDSKEPAPREEAESALVSSENEAVDNLVAQTSPASAIN